MHASVQWVGAPTRTVLENKLTFLHQKFANCGPKMSILTEHAVTIAHTKSVQETNMKYCL